VSTISIRLNEHDDLLIRKYAELHHMDLSTLIRQAIIEKIEDEFDLELFEKVWKKEQYQSRLTHEELKRELGL